MFQMQSVDANAKREVEALKIIRKEVKSDHVMKAIAYFQQRHINSQTLDHCFILPWAQRGNLRDFWIDGQTSSKTDLNWVLRQLLGLIEAIAEMHGLKGDRNLRHGDLKPENILCFQDDPQSEIRLVITDVGLAKTHAKATDKRMEMQEFTSTKVSTSRYEAPELKAQDDKARVLPRAFDVWAMGCIGMEFVIWLLYGLTGLVRFTDETMEFWESTGEQKHRAANLRVHRRVETWLSYMASEDGRCGADTALGKVIKLIKDDLIVVKVRSLAPEEDGGDPAPAQPKSSKGKWSRLLERTVNVPVFRVPYRSSSAEAAKRLRKIADGQAARNVGPSGPGNTGGPPPPGSSDKKNKKKKRR
jgi:serine/threonine protein kinase